MPIAFFIGIIPFIAYLKIINFNMSIYEWYANTAIFPDLFTYYKSLAVILITVIAIILYFKYLLNSKYMKLDLHQYYYPLIAYFALMLLSWIFSPYSYTASMGYMERFEGGLVLSGYLILFFYITQLINSEYDVKWITKFFIGSIVVMSLIGLLQYFKLDYMRVEFIQKLVIPKAYENSSLSFNVLPGRVYMTLYHPNYVGLYIALVLPFIITFFLCEKNLKKKVLYGLLSIAILVNLLGSQSRGGIIGVAFAAIMALIFLRKQIFRYWKVLIPVGVVCLALLVIMDFRSDHNNSNRIKQTIAETFGQPTTYPLNSIVTDGNSLHIDYKESPITISYKNKKNFESLSIKDVNNQPIPYTYEDGVYTIMTVPYNTAQLHCMIHQNEPYIKFISSDNSQWAFALTDQGFKFLNPYGKLVDLNEVPATGFQGKERMGSARGYIWSRSIPMLKDAIFIGHGPDSYIFEFPQNDYVGKYNAYQTQNMIVDKPHNIYLQIALNTGVLSLIAMLIFWGMYIVSCVKLYFRNALDDYLSITGIALFLGICGYLAAGIFNDGNVSVSPIYWGMIGLGFAVNTIVKKKLVH